MAPAEDIALLARFVKLMGDRGRLAIIGLLAAKPRPLDELDEELTSMSRATLQRNLKLLEDADWISSEENGCYKLRVDSLTTLRAAVARVDASVGVGGNVTAPAPTASAPAESSQAVVHAFFDDRGRLRRLPAQRRQRELVLGHITERLFTLGRTYDEQEVDDLLKPVYEDYPNLRRALVDEGALEHRGDRYWLSLRK